MAQYRKSGGFLGKTVIAEVLVNEEESNGVIYHNIFYFQNGEVMMMQSCPRQHLSFFLGWGKICQAVLLGEVPLVCVSANTGNDL